jgi:DNA-binding PadR family transcriptional regulator
MFGNFGPLIKHAPHSINFTILIFINEKKRYSSYLYKIWNKIISFDIKKGNLRQVIGKMEKKKYIALIYKVQKWKTKNLQC